MRRPLRVESQPLAGPVTVLVCAPVAALLAAAAHSVRERVAHLVNALQCGCPLPLRPPPCSVTLPCPRGHHEQTSQTNLCALPPIARVPTDSCHRMCTPSFKEYPAAPQQMAACGVITTLYCRGCSCATSSHLEAALLFRLDHPPPPLLRHAYPAAPCTGGAVTYGGGGFEVLAAASLRQSAAVAEVHAAELLGACATAGGTEHPGSNGLTALPRCPHLQSACKDVHQDRHDGYPLCVCLPACLRCVCVSVNLSLYDRDRNRPAHP